MVPYDLATPYFYYEWIDWTNSGGEVARTTCFAWGEI